MRSHERDVNRRRQHRPTQQDRPEPDAADLDGAAQEFQRLRPRLFGIAYRITGTVSEAEDVVQDVWLRWHGCDRDAVEHPEAFLVTTTTRTAINVLHSARLRRETYIGPWLPEPISTEANPELEAEHNESLSFALLVVLESLSPSERAAFVLREAFGYEYDTIAEVLDTTVIATRKLVSRAREKVASGRRRTVPVPQHRRLLQAFLTAARSGDVRQLESVLADDVVSFSDGGDVVHAARIAIVGRPRVVQFVAAVSSWFWADVEVHLTELNAEPAIVVVAGGEVVTVISICASGDGIARLFWLLNPDKLDHLRAAA